MCFACGLWLHITRSDRGAPAAVKASYLQINQQIRRSTCFVRNGSALWLQDLGSSEIFPASVQHNANGRFVSVCGDGEYVVYTALAWRNKSFGEAADFVWSWEPNDFATRQTSSSTITLHKNFKVQLLYGHSNFWYRAQLHSCHTQLPLAVCCLCTPAHGFFLMLPVPCSAALTKLMCLNEYQCVFVTNSLMPSLQHIFGAVVFLSGNEGQIHNLPCPYFPSPKHFQIQETNICRKPVTGRMYE